MKRKPKGPDLPGQVYVRLRVEYCWLIGTTVRVGVSTCYRLSHRWKWDEVVRGIYKFFGVKVNETEIRKKLHQAEVKRYQSLGNPDHAFYRKLSSTLAGGKNPPVPKGTPEDPFIGPEPLPTVAKKRLYRSRERKFCRREKAVEQWTELGGVPAWRPLEPLPREEPESEGRAT